jgi:aminoglycoside phosphotransferase family enzyme
MHEPEIEAKVACLRRPETYPGPTHRVETRETHMSWVFLTDQHAYKLKKPVRYEFLDYSTLEARHRTCEEEVRLNRRLADGVYCGIVPLTWNDGQLRLSGSGEIVDWLVKMRRLPEHLMLDHAIAARTVTVYDTRRVGTVLADFYHTAPIVPMTASDYLCHLTEDIRLGRDELVRPKYDLPDESLEAITAAQLNFLAENAELFAARIEAERIVEAHGDLRPEHICLERVPVIIDCLEFSRSLRLLDAASEVAFLWLECERLGSPDAGRLIFESYCDARGDRPPRSLIAFYKSYHACVRAKIAAWHLNDHQLNNRVHWIEKARHYLRLAAENMRVGMLHPTVGC